MKNWIVLLLSATLAFVACEKDDDNGDPGVTNPIPPGNSGPEFNVDFQNKKEAFGAMITRHTCGICGQSGHPTFDATLNSNPDLTGVSFSYNASDPLYHQEGNQFAQRMNLSGTPSFTEEFDNFTNSPSRWKSAITEFQSTPASAYIAMNGMLEDGSFDIEVKVAVTTDESQTNPHLAVYMLENNVVSPQTDYGASPSRVEDYIHNHVYRGSATGLFGEPVTDMWSVGDTITKTYTFTPDQEINSDNVYFVALLVQKDNAGNAVGIINSQQLRR